MKTIKQALLGVLIAASFASCVVVARPAHPWVRGHWEVGPYGGRHWVPGHYA